MGVAAMVCYFFFFFFINYKARVSIYRRKSNTIHPEIPNSDLRAVTSVSRVYPAFRTQWNRFRKLIRKYVRVMAENAQFELNRFKRFSRRFNLYRTNGKSNWHEIWNLAIISHYASDETSFVEIRDFLKNGYFNSPN